MKKLFPFLVIAIIFVVSTACAMSAPAATPTPAFTPTSAFTETPAPTETPVASPTPLGPYALISAEKAEFWFPIPDKKKWEWKITTKGKPCECYSMLDSWSITIPSADNTEYDVTFYYKSLDPIDDKSYTLQTGSFEELFKLMENQIMVVSNGSGHTTSGDLGMTTSISNNGVLIELTNPTILKSLNSAKPSVLKFSFPSGVEEKSQFIKVTPTYQ